MEQNKFEVIILGIIFDPKKRKILIGKREHDEIIPQLKWCFPGGRAIYKEDIDKTLKRVINEKTGLIIKNLGAFFAKTYEEKDDLLAVYFLTRAFAGKEKAGGDIKELKWVSPKDLDKYFTTSYHKKLKKFINELV
jgi:ADP-ribose pyrophosphatase YjhB (NUDIX family)